MKSPGMLLNFKENREYTEEPTVSFKEKVSPLYPR